MTDDKHIDQGLDDFFAAEIGTAIDPSDALMARIMADAGDYLPAAPVISAAKPVGFISKMLEVVGGWPSVAGLATASVVGVWVGYVQPDAIETFTDILISTDAESYLFDINPASSLF